MKLTAKNSARYLTASNSLRACVRARGMRAGMGQVRVVGEGRGVRCEVSSVRCGER